MRRHVRQDGGSIDTFQRARRFGRQSRLVARRPRACNLYIFAPFARHARGPLMLLMYIAELQEAVNSALRDNPDICPLNSQFGPTPTWDRGVFLRAAPTRHTISTAGKPFAPSLRFRRLLLVNDSYERLDCGQRAFWNPSDSVLHCSSQGERHQGHRPRLI
jgi:hypothetical protein